MISRALLVLISLAFVSGAGGARARRPPAHLFVARSGSKDHIIDASGRIVLTPRAVAVWRYAEGLIVVSDGKRYGYMGLDGRLVIKHRFPWAEPFSEGLARVQIPGRQGRDDSWGFVDRAGRPAFRGYFRFANDFSEGLALVGTGRGCSFVDRHGRIAIKGPFDWADDFSEGLAPVENGYRWGYVDKTGAVVIPLQYGSALRFSEGLAAVSELREGSPMETPLTGSGYVDRTGRMVIPARFSSTSRFSEGLGLVTIGDRYVPSPNHLGRALARGQWLFVDRTGETVLAVDRTATRLRGFSEGRAYVEYEDGRKGFLDTTGRLVVELERRVASADDFTGGVARVHLEDTSVGYIDTAGRYVWAPSK